MLCFKIKIETTKEENMLSKIQMPCREKFEDNIFIQFFFQTT